MCQHGGNFDFYFLQTTGYGYTFKKPVCLGFVKKIDGDGREDPVTNEYVLSGDYEVEIAGVRYENRTVIDFIAMMID